ncbi:MAG: LemA family protein [Candidatus Pacebacteria bacterium]|nr:LemA family protein [Candidatus Paceibacterota bacterium]
MKKILLILIGAAAFAGLSLAGLYNSLVSRAQGVENQWAQVETQYQRRLDLIPNLVNSVEGIMKQEQTVFGLIAEARTRYSGAQTADEKALAATQIESALSRLLVVMENYPEIKSSENVTGLMDELAGTENRISVERRRYNDLVRDYNTAIKKFPANLIVGFFGFGERAYFEAAQGAEIVPEVEINTGDSDGSGHSDVFL